MLATVVTLLSVTGCPCGGGNGPDPPWVTEADVDRLAVVPHEVYVQSGEIEFRAVLRDGDGTILPEFLRDPVSGDTLDSPKLKVTWTVRSSDGSMANGFDRHPLRPYGHRILVRIASAVSPGVYSVVAEANGRMDTASLRLVAAAEAGDRLRVPTVPMPSVALIDVDQSPNGQSVEDSIVAAVGAAELDLEGSGEAILLLPGLRPDHDVIDWTGAVDVDEASGPAADTLPVAAWIATADLSEDSVDALESQAAADVALANSILTDSRTGLHLQMLSGYPRALPDHSTKESFPMQPLLCTALLNDPAPPKKGYDFRPKVVHALYVQQGGLRGEECGYHANRTGALIVIYTNDFTPITFAHELGHALSLDHLDTGMVLVPGGEHQINVMYDGTPTGGANTTHLTLGQAARATLGPESFVWKAERPADQQWTLLRQGTKPPGDLPDVGLDFPAWEAGVKP